MEEGTGAETKHAAAVPPAVPADGSAGAVHAEDTDGMPGTVKSRPTLQLNLHRRGQNYRDIYARMSPGTAKLRRETARMRALFDATDTDGSGFL